MDHVVLVGRDFALSDVVSRSLRPSVVLPTLVFPHYLWIGSSRN